MRGVLAFAVVASTMLAGCHGSAVDVLDGELRPGATSQPPSHTTREFDFGARNVWVEAAPGVFALDWPDGATQGRTDGAPLAFPDHGAASGSGIFVDPARWARAAGDWNATTTGVWTVSAVFDAAVGAFEVAAADGCARLRAWFERDGLRHELGATGFDGGGCPGGARVVDGRLAGGNTSLSERFVIDFMQLPPASPFRAPGTLDLHVIMDADWTSWNVSAHAEVTLVDAAMLPRFTVELDQATYVAGEPITGTIRLHNDGPFPFAHTTEASCHYVVVGLMNESALVAETPRCGAGYAAVWRHTLPPDATWTFGFALEAPAAPGDYTVVVPRPYLANWSPATAASVVVA